MKLTLSPKDNINKIVLDVETYCQEGNCLLVIFPDGRARSFPMQHLWYWEGEVPSGADRSKPPTEEEKKYMISWINEPLAFPDMQWKTSKPDADGMTTLSYGVRTKLPDVEFSGGVDDTDQKQKREQEQRRRAKWKADGLTWAAILAVLASLYVIYETKDLTFLAITCFFAWLAVELGRPTARARRA